MEIISSFFRPLLHITGLILISFFLQILSPPAPKAQMFIPERPAAGNNQPSLNTSSVRYNPYSLNLAYDPDWQPKTVARDIYSAHRAYSFLINSFTDLPPVENRWMLRIGRTAKLFAIDFPLSSLATAMQRNLGVRFRAAENNVSYSADIAYSSISLADFIEEHKDAYTENTNLYGSDEHILTAASGINTRKVMAEFIREQSFKDGAIDYQTGLLYLYSQTVIDINGLMGVSDSRQNLLFGKGVKYGPFMIDPGLVDYYVGMYLKHRRNPEKQYTKDELYAEYKSEVRSAYQSFLRFTLWNSLLDPYSWYSLGGAVRYAWTGEKEYDMPWIMPYTGGALTPIGLDYQLGTHIRTKRWFSSVVPYARWGEGPEEFYGGGVKFTDIKLTDAFKLNYIAGHFWEQPGMSGAALDAEIAYRISENFSWTLRGIYKEKGYLLGEPVNEGAYFRTGIEILFGKESPAPQPDQTEILPPSTDAQRMERPLLIFQTLDSIEKDTHFMRPAEFSKPATALSNSI